MPMSAIKIICVSVCFAYILEPHSQSTATPSPVLQYLYSRIGFQLHVWIGDLQLSSIPVPARTRIVIIIISACAGEPLVYRIPHAPLSCDAILDWERESWEVYYMFSLLPINPTTYWPWAGGERKEVRT